MATAGIELVRPAAVATTEHGGTTMMQQMAQSQIQAAYIWAERNPRDWDVIESRAMKECSRPEFVEIDTDPKKYGSSTAMYGVPRGGEYQNGKWVPNIVTGFTIRFVEMILPMVKNLDINIWPIDEDDEQRIYRVERIDYESNNREGEIIFVAKTLERKSLKDGEVPLGTRKNSQGKDVYIVKATAEEIETAKSRQYSKVKRNLVLNVLPGWLKSKCEKQIRLTQRTKDAEDPDKARKILFAGFEKVGVKVEDLKKYMGHDGTSLQPAELEELRMIYSAIADGHTTWRQVLAAREDADAEGGEDKIQALFDALEYTPAQARNIKATYIGRPEKLLSYLEELVAKKKNDGGAPQESKQTVAQATTTTAKAADPQPEPTKPVEKQQEPTQEQPVQQAKPEPVRQEPTQKVTQPTSAPAKKPAPPIAKGW